MHGDKRSGTGVITESEVQAALRRGPSPGLDASEERVLRMRVGAGVPRGAALERIAVASDAEIDVLAYEIEAYLFLKAREARSAPTAPPPSRSRIATSRTKEKIIRALRHKS